MPYRNTIPLPLEWLLMLLALAELALFGWVRSWGSTVRLDVFILVFGAQFVLFILAVALVKRPNIDRAPAGYAPPTSQPASDGISDRSRGFAPAGYAPPTSQPASDGISDGSKGLAPAGGPPPAAVGGGPPTGAGKSYVSRLYPARFRHLRVTIIVLLAGLAFRILMADAYPVLSSDAFRYVWDGRVQAAGFSPYDYPPGATELTFLRDAEVWPRINRKASITIYPPAAQALFFLIHLVGGDSLLAVKWAMVLADGLTMGLLLLLLRALNQPLEYVILYAWHPLVVYELVASAHLEALMLPCLVLALWATKKGHDATAGVALALATLMKLFPVLLLPALWRRRGWRMPLAFALTCAVVVAPYLDAGPKIITYYPMYLREQFNMSLAALLGETLRWVGAPDPYRIVQLLLWVGVAGLGIWHVIRPDGEGYLRRCLTMIGLLTIGSQFLHPWYIVWIIPFLTVLSPSARDKTSDTLLAVPYTLRITTWLAWLIFSGNIVLSYHFYIYETYYYPVFILEYLPLYGLLFWPWLRRIPRGLVSWVTLRYIRRFGDTAQRIKSR